MAVRCCINKKLAVSIRICKTNQMNPDSSLMFYLKLVTFSQLRTELDLTGECELLIASCNVVTFPLSAIAVLSELALRAPKTCEEDFIDSTSGLWGEHGERKNDETHFDF